MTTTDPAVAFLRAFYSDPDGVGPHYSAAHVSAVRKGLDAAWPLLTTERYEAAFLRGRNVGAAEAEARALDREFAGTARPTEYEVWRDALLIAAASRLPTNLMDLDRMGEVIRDRLKATVPEPDYDEDVRVDDMLTGYGPAGTDGTG